VTALLALLSSALWGTADFVGGTLTRRLPVTLVIGVSQAVALVLLVPLALLLDVADPGRVVLPGLLAGVVGPAGLAAFYRALALGTMGVVAPVAALGVVVPVAAGLLAGESPSALQLVGIAVAVVGVVLACGPELSGAGRGGALPLLLAAAAAVGFGAVLLLLAEGSGGEAAGVGDVVLVLLVMRLTSVALLLGVTLLRRARPAAGGCAGRSAGAGPGGAVRRRRQRHLRRRQPERPGERDGGARLALPGGDRAAGLADPR
jgi:drug/metabolite transporter (DMT)-like permease